MPAKRYQVFRNVALPQIIVQVGLMVEWSMMLACVPVLLLDYFEGF